MEHFQREVIFLVKDAKLLLLLKKGCFMVNESHLSPISTNGYRGKK